MAENTNINYDVINYTQSVAIDINDIQAKNLIEIPHSLNTNTPQNSSSETSSRKEISNTTQILKLEDILRQWNLFDELYGFLKGKNFFLLLYLN